MGVFGPAGAWSLGTPVASEQPLPPTTAFGRPPQRRLSKSLPSSPTASGFAHAQIGGMEQHGGMEQRGRAEAAFSSGVAHNSPLDAHFYDLLEQERHRTSFNGGGGGFSSTSSPTVSRPSSPAFGLPHPHPAHPASPTHSRSSSRTRFTGRLEFPLAPTSSSSSDPQTQALLSRVVELERAYGELAQAYQRLEMENAQWKALASPTIAVGGGGRSGSASPRGISPSGSRSPSRAGSRPPSPSHPSRPSLSFHPGHGPSRSLSSLSAFTPLTPFPVASGVADIPRPSSALGGMQGRVGRSQQQFAAGGGGISRPSSASGERRLF